MSDTKTEQQSSSPPDLSEGEKAAAKAKADNLSRLKERATASAPKKS